ncbi:hypothetical protein QFZ31_000337 [Neobacillus niacini]|nr:hypothetical protein [Neobacillus niacini]MDQ0970459.1 hypothetical protein [Neobacillus niacini]
METNIKKIRVCIIEHIKRYQVRKPSTTYRKVEMLPSTRLV